MLTVARQLGRVAACVVVSVLLVLLVPSASWSTHCDPAVDPNCVSHDPTPTPTPDPTPSPTAPAGTDADPMIVRLDDETTALLLLTSSLLALGVGARVVGSFGGR